MSSRTLTAAEFLRAHPGVRTVKLAISRPWAN